MKTFFKSFFFLSMFAVSFNLFAQSENLLETLPVTDEEFAESEEQAINTINWLNSTPINQGGDERDKQNALLIAWLTNSPTVTIEVNINVLPFIDKNPELLITFMGGWTKYCLENDYSKETIPCTLAGIKSAIDYYKNDNGLKKDKKMEKLIELDSKNELENWVKEQLK